MKTYKKIMDIIAVIEMFVMSVILVGVTVITVANVTVRKLTDFQFAWSEELVINFFVLLIMLGGALSVREGSMISLSLFYDRASDKGKKVFAVIIFVASMIFWIILLKTGYEKVLTQMANGKRTFSLGWQEWIFTSFLPIGGFFIILHEIEHIIDVFTAKPETEEGGDK